MPFLVLLPTFCQSLVRLNFEIQIFHEALVGSNLAIAILKVWIQNPFFYCRRIEQRNCWRIKLRYFWPYHSLWWTIRWIMLLTKERRKEKHCQVPATKKSEQCLYPYRWNICNKCCIGCGPLHGYLWVSVNPWCCSLIYYTS